METLSLSHSLQKTEMKEETLTLILVNLAAIMEKADEALLPGVYKEVGAALHTDPTGLGSLTLLRSIVQSSCYPLAAYLALHHDRAQVIALGAFLWSAATFLVAVSSTYFQDLEYCQSPYAVSEGGWLSLILLFRAAVIDFYGGILLRRCIDVNPNIRSYSDIGELAFGYKGRIIIALVMYLELYLIAVEFMILQDDNLNMLFPNMSFKVFELKITGRQGAEGLF